MEDKDGDISKNYQVFDEASHRAFLSYVIFDNEGGVLMSVSNI